ncbi:three component ABC system middle component [Pseudomonas syringae group genomosp. 3]|uniref:three component ABC system middle component n=1 Tax=Pseudomonas syringae group genomosp. 3 TaxID=251701 RepID=UPI000EFF7DBA|nr:three component ABC system middle component [Pseudomonas syringae group genomosp. 3]
MNSDVTDDSSALPRLWSGYNNAGIAAVGIGCVLNHCQSLTLARALLITPIIMHTETTKFLASERTRSRQIASLVAIRPDFVLNFDRRFHAGLVHSINGIQLLHQLGFAALDSTLTLVKPFKCPPEFGKRAESINKASAEIASLLQASEEELYLNLRIQL